MFLAVSCGVFVCVFRVFGEDMTQFFIDFFQKSAHNSTFYGLPADTGGEDGIIWIQLPNIIWFHEHTAN